MNCFASTGASKHITSTAGPFDSITRFLRAVLLRAAPPEIDSVSSVDCSAADVTHRRYLRKSGKKWANKRAALSGFNEARRVKPDPIGRHVDTRNPAHRAASYADHPIEKWAEMLIKRARSKRDRREKREERKEERPTHRDEAAA